MDANVERAEPEVRDDDICHQKLSGLKRSEIIWKDWQLAILKAGWNSGLTGSQIGSLVGKSRNAVIGKANRLKLGSRAVANQFMDSFGIKKERPPREPKEKMSPVRKKKAAPRFYPSAKPLTTKLPISIMELNAGTCHAIVGYGLDGLATYCGDYTFYDKPYCEAHCAMYYAPPAAYRRR